uniref:Alpha-1,3-mannosyltransferase CMT1 n=1 Tax=Chromera velia CCMP2878 TaxID=1169474 RepID=A0A0G4GBL2_9ALVE|mmetsp:Transcript_3746/g.7714  ORF Transcript_3746/g.7714 Transcript_3746/m.7714 type:complete len:472 (-) Transcript_3746:771-2186(-)|eukprot:Cvel_21128.t1-p1 / transcript=Cvel_21128.t1 / gene=Cvel_21128 / organism=Chromera_velia_CCMP2878 / gene_product=Alpha-1,3-mannosyltransferase CMT1, putative / transcript_product=Alpha-1,3-mannosyltransferase CMT1, putative / location=Cvel_scaffold1957:1506-3373(+) / protein_length=471 / sequence_SO=supercontig / SO=protein_coding / is_pseudo=false
MNSVQVLLFCLVGLYVIVAGFTVTLLNGGSQSTAFKSSDEEFLLKKLEEAIPTPSPEPSYRPSDFRKWAETQRPQLGQCTEKYSKGGDGRDPVTGKFGKPTRVFITALLHQNEDILPQWIANVLEVIEVLGTENVFVSINEGGSNDGTSDLLRNMETELNLMGVPNQMMIDDNESVPFKYKKGDRKGSPRIEYLAKLRNIAMAPLWEMKENEGIEFDRVLFLNDVIFCPGDALRLLAYDEADMACAHDYNIYGGKPVFYDSWVMRKGHFQDHREGELSVKAHFSPERKEEELHEACPPAPAACPKLASKAYQVFSCWNGMVQFRTEPIYQGVRFRWGMKGECRDSESALLPLDLWKLGYNKILADPSIQLSYTQPGYEAAFRQTSLFSEEEEGPEHPQWDDTWPETKTCQELFQPGGHAPGNPFEDSLAKYKCAPGQDVQTCLAYNYDKPLYPGGPVSDANVKNTFVTRIS